MECLIPTFSFDIFVENYFTSFRLFTRLRVNNIWATGVLDKNRLRKCIIGDKQLEKKGKWPLWTALVKQKNCNFDSGWLEQQQSGLHSFFWILWT